MAGMPEMQEHFPAAEFLPAIDACVAQRNRRIDDERSRALRFSPRRRRCCGMIRGAFAAASTRGILRNFAQNAPSPGIFCSMPKKIFGYDRAVSARIFFRARRACRGRKNICAHIRVRLLLRARAPAIFPRVTERFVLRAA